MIIDEEMAEKIGGLMVGEEAWHCVQAAISALEKGDDLQALAILRALRVFLASATGREMPDPFILKKAGGPGAAP